MDFLIVGCGSIGQRHLKNALQLGHRVWGCDTQDSRAQEVRQAYGVEVFSSLEAALKRHFDGVFVCTPTVSHIPIAKVAVDQGLNVFIEKPLSGSVDGINELQAMADEKKLVTFIACNMRFLPALRLLKELVDAGEIGSVLSARVECGFYLPYWHPDEDYRLSYSANRSLGGGVIFDDIHELDALYWLLGEAAEVFCYAAHVSDLIIDTEDLAEIFIKYRSGVVAQLHLDYLQRTYRRTYKFIGEKGSVALDLISLNVELYREAANQWQVFQESINTPREIMFINQLKHFVDCVEGRVRPENDIASAKNVLQTALACHESSAGGKVVRL